MMIDTHTDEGFLLISISKMIIGYIAYQIIKSVLYSQLSITKTITAETTSYFDILCGHISFILIGVILMIFLLIVIKIIIFLCIFLHHIYKSKDGYKYITVTCLVICSSLYIMFGSVLLYTLYERILYAIFFFIEFHHFPHQYSIYNIGMAVFFSIATVLCSIVLIISSYNVIMKTINEH